MRSFFFSSRRRHTRSLCDWSSDVCSSDLHRRGTDRFRDAGPSLWPCHASRADYRSEEHTSELQSHSDLVCRLLLEKKKIAEVEVWSVLVLYGARSRGGIRVE